MVTFIEKSKYYPIRALDFYLLFSFVVSLILWFSFYNLSDHFFLKHGFFVTAFLIGNYYFFTRGLGYSYFLEETPLYPGLFLFQTITLMGIAFTENSHGGVYLSMVPCVTGVYFFFHKEYVTKADQKSKALVLLVIAMCSYLFFYGLTNKSLISFKESIIMAGFVIWTVSIIYWGLEYGNKEQLSILSVFLSRKNDGKSSGVNEVDDQKQRLFFHDLINQTHGVNLFLNFKIAADIGLSVEECRNVVEEIRLMQSLIKDHFGFKHKNLLNTYEYVSFDFAKKGIQRLVRNYLPEHLVQCHFVLQGMISPDVPRRERSGCLVHYPSLYRIITNLVKNVAEKKAEEVEINFNYQEKGLTIFVKNKVFLLKDDNANLAQSLGDIILNNDKNKKNAIENGLGLESVAALCDKMGGSFKFCVEGDYWVNQVFLPNPAKSTTDEDKEVEYKQAA